jgi:hypothetical protein
MPSRALFLASGQEMVRKAELIYKILQKKITGVPHIPAYYHICRITISLVVSTYSSFVLLLQLLI